jgi:hypothetical protein
VPFCSLLLENKHSPFHVMLLHCTSMHCRFRTSLYILHISGLYVLGLYSWTPITGLHSTELFFIYFSFCRFECPWVYNLPELYSYFPVLFVPWLCTIGYPWMKRNVPRLYVPPWYFIIFHGVIGTALEYSMLSCGRDRFILLYDKCDRDYCILCITGYYRDWFIL